MRSKCITFGQVSLAITALLTIYKSEVFAYSQDCAVCSVDQNMQIAKQPEDLSQWVFKVANKSTKKKKEYLVMEVRKESDYCIQEWGYDVSRVVYDSADQPHFLKSNQGWYIDTNEVAAYPIPEEFRKKYRPTTYFKFIRHDKDLYLYMRDAVEHVKKLREVEHPIHIGSLICRYFIAFDTSSNLILGYSDNEKSLKDALKNSGY
jgi:hypothetical protein